MRKDQVICCFFWGHAQLLGYVALHVVAHGNPSPMTPVGSILFEKNYPVDWVFHMGEFSGSLATRIDESWEMLVPLNL